MSARVDATAEERRALEGGGIAVPRCIGVVDGAQSGPTLVVTCGVHGNEIAGVLAARRVLARVTPTTLRGRLVVLGANLEALARGVRFVDRDLNRRWVDPEAPGTGDSEDRERHELDERFHDEAERARGPLTFLDLHTTSAASPPFACFGDTVRNHELATALGVPALFGLDEVLDGTMLGLMTDRGHIAVSVEGGQHKDARSVAHLEAAAWLAMIRRGMVRPEQVPDLASRRAELARATHSVPALLEVTYRHVTTTGDGFVMEPGFRSFQPVESGTILARDLRGPIVARERAVVIMPRYQGQGDDGFFLARAMSARRLALASLLRRVGIERAVARLPGIARCSRDGDAIVVDTRLAPVHAAKVLHLCGYRRVRREGSHLHFSRRRQGGVRVE